MKICCLYPQEHFGDFQSNLDEVKALLAKSKKWPEQADLAIFPPLYLTGVGLNFEYFRPELCHFVLKVAIPELAKLSKKTIPFIITYYELDRTLAVLHFQDGKYEKFLCPDLPIRDAKTLKEHGLIPLIFSLLPSYLDGKGQLATLAELFNDDHYLIFSPAKGNSSSDGAFLGELQSKTKNYRGVFKEVIDFPDIQPEEFLHKFFFSALRHELTLPIREPSRPEYPLFPVLDDDLLRALEIPTEGLRQRLAHLNGTKLILGLSGGMDSAIAAVFARRALLENGQPLSDLLLYYLPGFGSTEQSYQQALALAEGLSLELHNIDIRPACEQHFKDIAQDPELHDITYENSQARERTQILMDLANKEGGIVLGTGTLSEAALGWCTYNGDQMSMYHVNGGIPKTLVPELLRLEATISAAELPEYAKALQKLAKAQASPELLPATGQAADSKLGLETSQVTENVLGPYKIYDYFLWHFRANWLSAGQILKQIVDQELFADIPAKERYEYMKRFLWRFYTQSFKRRSMPDFPVLYAEDLAATRAERLPSDFSPKYFLDLLEEELN
ncbi:MAG: NAD(+) synthase [Eubacteriales bacterium]|nr:NAD(+) synthase [Eubacteriales bacterium]